MFGASVIWIVFFTANGLPVMVVGETVSLITGGIAWARLVRPVPV
ncbi:hypothetical protein [Cryobacterium sp. 5B3]|nr:hypothetical protein [Cryobacterium sp. 5B3]MDY7541810.1 hypothetical protein [Cryobacterium sp. 5B3]MEB0276367.1 hypothetical protein [Cryobacterium sp. 5B3]